MRHLVGLVVSSRGALNRGSIFVPKVCGVETMRLKQSPFGGGDKIRTCLCKKLNPVWSWIKARSERVRKKFNENPGVVFSAGSFVLAYLKLVDSAQTFLQECEATLSDFASRHPVTELRIGRQYLYDETKVLDALDVKLDSHLRSWWWGTKYLPWNMLVLVPNSLYHSLDFAQQVNAAHIQFIRDNDQEFQNKKTEIKGSHSRIEDRCASGSWAGDAFDRRTPWYFSNALCAMYHRREAYRAQSLSDSELHLKLAEGYYKNAFIHSKCNCVDCELSDLYKEFDSNKVDFKISEGYLYLQKGDYKEARTVFENVLKNCDATLGYAHLGLAMCLVQEARSLGVNKFFYKRKLLEDALAICNEQIQRTSSKKHKYHHMVLKADILLLQGKYREADILHDRMQKMLVHNGSRFDEPSKDDVHPDVTYHRYVARIKNPNANSKDYRDDGSTRASKVGEAFYDEQALKNRALIASGFYHGNQFKPLFFNDQNAVLVERKGHIKQFDQSSTGYYDTTGNNSRFMLFPTLTQSSAGSPQGSSAQQLAVNPPAPAQSNG